MDIVRRDFARVLHRAAIAGVFLGGAVFAPLSLAAVAQEDAQELLNAGKAAEALSRIDGYLAKHPEDAQARFTKGLALVKLGRNKDAIRVFADLTRDYPQLPEPYNNLAVLYAGEGDYEKARDALKAAVLRHPGYAAAHENLGDIYTALAAAAYNKVLALNPNNQDARRKLGTLRQIDSAIAAAPPAAPSVAPAPPAPIAAAPATPAVAMPKPSATPTEPPRGGDAHSRQAAALAAVQAWAQAWESKDFDGYFGAYAPEYTPEGGVSRQTWEAQRRDRISRPKKIGVEVIDPKLDDIEDGGVRVSFRQRYTSDSFSDSVNKVIELAPIGGGWKIVREYTR